MNFVEMEENEILRIIDPMMDNCLRGSNEDNLFIESLMVPEHKPGKYASWIAAPDQGIDNKSGDFEYVKVHDA